MTKKERAAPISRHIRTGAGQQSPILTAMGDKDNAEGM
jgi:hypothetical protein